jgi:choice-of-anchor B domain-containing protein
MRSPVFASKMVKRSGNGWDLPAGTPLNPDKVSYPFKGRSLMGRCLGRMVTSTLARWLARCSRAVPRIGASAAVVVLVSMSAERGAGLARAHGGGQPTTLELPAAPEHGSKGARTRARRQKHQQALADRQAPMALAATGATPCAGGMAGIYPCQNVDLMAFLPLAAIGGGNGNDVWGWTDPVTGREYALMGRTTGTAFVDVTDPSAPVYLGNLPTHSAQSIWRGIKVYADHAFIGSEAPGHGLQIFDLRQLRTVSAPPVTFVETGHYSGFVTSHTLAVNEATGFLYAAGSNTCRGGLHVVDVRQPGSPVFAGCVSEDGYTHETQCVLYRGPDARYRDREICFNSNGDTLTVVDVTDKSAPVQLSRTGYSGYGYVHQGWLTEDHAHFLLDDERDETRYGHPTRTWMWDVSNLTGPVVMGAHDGPTRAIDHNQYVRGGHVYQANYRAGLRILDLAGIGTATLREVAYFDIYPTDDEPRYNGAWSTFPFFASGTVLVSGIEQGLFVLRPRLDAPAGPDLVVSALTVPPVASPGLAVSVAVTTQNAGGSAASDSTTRLYFSPDAVWDAGDVEIGAHPSGPLVAGASSPGTVEVTLPPSATAGTSHVIARANAGGTAGEADETNNTRSAAITIRVADLIVSALSAPAAAVPGTSIAVTDGIRNVSGAVAAAPSTTRIYLSAKTTLDDTAVLLGERPVSALAPGTTSAATTTVTIPASTPAGQYHVIALADAVHAVAESNEGNNARRSAIAVGHPDLVVSALSAPSSAKAGTAITVSETTRNQGPSAVGTDTTTRFYLSRNPTWDAGDTPLGNRPVPNLRGLQASTRSTTLTVPAGTPPGAYYLVARADADGEVDEGTGELNNTRSRALSVAP